VSGSGTRCPVCGTALAPESGVCRTCRTPLRTEQEPIAAPDGNPLSGVDGSWGPPLSRERERTRTGLLLITVAFGLLWIPYIEGIGELMVIVGALYLWLGRRAFPPAHRRNVGVSGGLIVTGILLAVVLVAWFLVDFLTSGGGTGGGAGGMNGPLPSDLTVFILAALVSSSLLAAAYVLLPFALADARTRILLVVAAILTVALAAVSAFVLLPQAGPAVNQALSGGTFHPGALAGFERESVLLGLTQIVPDFLFLVAYYRTRARLFALRPPGGEVPPTASGNGRTE
jgi:hypothetical protein